jgi:DNA ligase 1
MSMILRFCSHITKEMVLIFLYPMLLQTYRDGAFESKEYCHEVKWNGIRVIYTKDTIGKEQFFTRHKTLITSFPEILNLAVPNDTILDGELVYLHEGVEQFSKVMERFKLTNDYKIHVGAEMYPCLLVIFDVLKWDGVFTTALPLIERKNILSQKFIETDRVKLIEHRLYDGISLFNEVEAVEREGIVSRKLHSPYLVAKRATQGEIYKIINWRFTEAFITGYRKGEFGLLTSRKNEISGRWEPLGIVEFGMSIVHKKAFFQIAKQLILNEDKKHVYLEPLIRCRLKSRGFTENNLLFTPVFVEFLL